MGTDVRDEEPYVCKVGEGEDSGEGDQSLWG